MIEVHNVCVTSIGYLDNEKKKTPCYTIYMQETERIKNIKKTTQFIRGSKGVQKVGYI